MSNRKEITETLSLSVEKHINPHNDPRIYWAREVTFDYSTQNAVRVDFMRFKPVNNTVSGIEKGDFYCYEVKSSVEDFHSKNGHNFIGDFNYYVMLEEVYEKVKDEIPYGVGVFIPTIPVLGSDGRRWYDLESVKKAKQKDRSRPVSEMLLMMFRSCARERGYLMYGEKLLNPCPKCGGKPILHTRDIKWLADCTIQCLKCDMFVHCQTKEEAIEEWNKKEALASE